MDIINISAYEEIEENFERFLDGDVKGKISLPVPVLNILKWKPVTERLSAAAGISAEDMDRVVYYAAYIVLDPMETRFEKNTILSEKEYQEAVTEYGTDSFRKGQGAEALVEAFSGIDCKSEMKKCRMQEVSLMQRLEKLRNSLGETDNEAEQGLDESCEIETREPTPEEMEAEKEKEAIFTELDDVRKKMTGIWYLQENKGKMLISEVSLFPVGIRSFVKEAVKNESQFYLDIVDHAYAIYSRARRVQLLADIKAPDIILRNEKRLLQEQVDSYITSNYTRKKDASGGYGAPVPGLADLILMEMPIV